MPLGTARQSLFLAQLGNHVSDAIGVQDQSRKPKNTVHTVQKAKKLHGFVTDLQTRVRREAGRGF